MNPKVFGALLVGVGLVAAAYLFAPQNTTSPVSGIGDSSVEPVVGAAPNRDFILVSDTDNDGIPDWQEELRVVEPARISESDIASTTAEPVDFTNLTSRVAVDLVKKTVLSEGYGNLGPTHDQIMRQTAVSLDEAAQDELFNRADLNIVTDVDEEILAEYGNSIARVFIFNSIPNSTQTEFEIFQEALDAQDETILEKLDPIIASYEKTVRELKELEVPNIIVREHLMLLNVANAILEDTKAMRVAFDDPLLATVRISRYSNDAMALSPALIDIYDKLYEQGARWSNSDIAYSLVTLEETE